MNSSSLGSSASISWGRAMIGCRKKCGFGGFSVSLCLSLVFSWAASSLYGQEMLRSQSNLNTKTRSTVEAKSSAQEPRKLTLNQSELVSLSRVGRVTEETAAMQRPGAFTPNLSARATQFSVPVWDVGPHKYLVLEKKSKFKHSRSAEQTPAPIVENRPVSPYAYGWFGTKMNRLPHRSFGYQQAYTQWAFE